MTKKAPLVVRREAFCESGSSFFAERRALNRIFIHLLIRCLSSSRNTRSSRGNAKRRAASNFYFICLILKFYHLTTTLKLSPSTATTAIPAGTAIVSLSDVATSLATTLHYDVLTFSTLHDDSTIRSYYRYSTCFCADLFVCCRSASFVFIHVEYITLLECLINYDATVNPT